MKFHKKELNSKIFCRAIWLLIVPFFILSCTGNQFSTKDLSDQTAQIETNGEAIVHGNLQFELIWGRPSFESSNGAVYLTIRNQGETAVSLMSVTAVIADAVEIHETKIENDVMQMRQITDGLEIPASGHVQMAPGGHHIMLIGLSQDLEEGDTYPITLHFEGEGDVEVMVEVIQP